MESTIGPADRERLLGAFMGRIARMVLPDNGGLDRREAHILIDCKVIRPETGPDSDETVERLQQAGEANDSLTGPVLFYPNHSGGKAVVRARDLLLDERLAVRQIGLDHLKRVATNSGSICSRTIQTIERSRVDLLSKTSGNWRRTAVEVVDALDDDWLLNVAGMRQCAIPALEELWTEFVTAVLRPSVSAINACSPSLLCPGLHRDQMAAEARALVAEHDIYRLGNRYLHTLGHLPLGGDLALHRAIALGASGGSQDMGLLIDWANQSRNPFARCHVCHAAMSSATKLTPEQLRLVAAWFWEVVCGHNSPAKASDRYAIWRVTIQLARYFMHYLEIRLPSDNSEAIAAMAWWMSSRLLIAIGNAEERLSSFSAQLDRVYGSMTSDIWDLVSPPMATSVVRWLTLFGPSPWALFLLSAVQSEDQIHSLVASPGQMSADTRVNALIAIAIQVAHLSLGEPGYGFSTDARRPLLWIASREPDEGRRRSQQFWAEGVDWSPPNSLDNALKVLDENDESLQRWICHGIRQRIATGGLNAEDLWAAVSTDEWKKSKWLKLDALSLQAIGCALIDDAARRSPEWRPQLPHLFADIAEQRASNDTDRQATFGILLKMCCALNAPSAIVRVLRGPSGHRFRSLATTVQGNVEQVLSQAGGWAAGRLRSLLINLFP